MSAALAVLPAFLSEIEASASDHGRRTSDRVMPLWHFVARLDQCIARRMVQFEPVGGWWASRRYAGALWRVTSGRLVVGLLQ